jgi:hypothetical protein
VAEVRSFKSIVVVVFRRVVLKIESEDSSLEIFLEVVVVKMLELGVLSVVVTPKELPVEVTVIEGRVIASPKSNLISFKPPLVDANIRVGLSVCKFCCCCRAVVGNVDPVEKAGVCSELESCSLKT